MREIALKLGFASALALLAPVSAVCAGGHTSKVAAHTVRPAAPVAHSSAHQHDAAPKHAAGKPKPAEAHAHAAGTKAPTKLSRGRELAVAARPRNGRAAVAVADRESARPLTRAEKAKAEKTHPLTRAEKRAAAAAEQARAERADAKARKGSKLTLASTRRSLHSEPEPPAANLRGHSDARDTRTPISRAPAAPAPQHMASLSSSQPAPERELQTAPAPVNVQHDRKVHYAAAGEADDNTPAAQPQRQTPARPAAPRASPAGSPFSGVSHPDEMDEQAPMPPARTAPAPIAQLPAGRPAATGAQAANAGQMHIMPVIGIGRQPSPAAQAWQFAQTQHAAAIGTPLMLAAASSPRSAVMTSSEALPPPALIPQVEPSAALKARLPSIEDEAAQTQLVPSLLYNHGQLVMPPALKGSREILVHQNTEADREGLTRVRDDDDLIRMRGSKLLIALPDQTGLAVDDRLPANRRFARPWTARFLADLARAHYAHFHTDLIVTSAVRTVEVQQRLIRTNGNAAPAEGETASPHLTGQAVDLGKKGLTMTEIAWMRGYLLPLVQKGKVDVEEEFQQACFHISVYRSYMPSAAGVPSVFPPHDSPAGSLATALPLR